MALSTLPPPVTPFAPSVAVDALIGCDRKGRVTVWNAAAAEMFGYTADDILGRSYMVLVPPKYRPAHEQGMWNRGSKLPRELSGGPRRWLGLKKDGTTFLFDLSLRWWVVSEGTCVLGSITAVTSESAAIGHPAVSFSHYDMTIAESIPQLVWLTNAPGSIEYANKRWYEYFGLTEADLELIAERPILHPDERAEWIEKWALALATGQTFEHECNLRRADGEYRWFLSRSVPLRDDSGKVHRWFGTSTDIHDQKMAQSALASQRDELESLVERRTRELQITVGELEAEAYATLRAQKAAQQSERRLQSALDGARDFVWDYDCLTGVAYRSKGWSSMLGYGDAPFDASIEHWHEIAHPEDQVAALQSFQDLLDDKVETHSVEYRLRDVSGAWLWIASKGKITERAEDGTPLKAAGTSADITERKHAEEALRAAKDEAERASRAKSEFLANMSHELRTPLNSVIGFANVLKRNRAGNLSSAELSYLDRIQANGVHLLRLIDDVLDLAKVEAGRMEMDISTVRLDELIHDLITQCEGQTHPGVLLRAELPRDRIFICADGLRLRQVLLNQLSNAIKFTERGSITVAVECNDAHEPIRIEVRDTGIGISPDRAVAIFNSFEQADTGTAKRYGGTGLGLAISRALCEQMGFTLTLKSEVGTGSTFIIGLVPEIVAHPVAPLGGAAAVPVISIPAMAGRYDTIDAGSR
ncbi:MAG: PAS domain-containing protein [Gemmatimonadaceae bacterium]|nr:PAS domain-containing protein [Gemmatimonadaceae bacterium]